MKKTNKGFSLVELIIVIAIMAILAGAIAPALIRYIDKSRKSNDVSAAKTVKTAIETALGNEQIYEWLAVGSGTADTQVLIVPGAASSSTNGNSAVKFFNTPSTAPDGLSISLVDCANEIATNIGETMPRCKYKKNAADPKNGTAKPVCFFAEINGKGTVKVGIYAHATETVSTITSAKTLVESGSGMNFFQLSPDLCSYYQ